MGGVIQRIVAGSGDAYRPGHARQRGWLKTNIFFLRQPAQHVVHALIGEGIEPVEQTLHGTANKARGTTHRQAIRRGKVIDPQILHRNLIVQTGIYPQQHARGVGRFGKEAVYVVAKGQLQPKRHPARATAHAARQIDKERVIRIHHTTLFGKLRLQALACHGIT